MRVDFRCSNVDIVHDAFAFAMIKHHGQMRKYTDQPYIVHPIAVADIVRAVGGTKEMVAAALLHDVLEDTDAKIYEMREHFGNKITDLVVELTDVYIHPHHGNRATRKTLERQRLAMISHDAMTIKVADLIDNSKTIVEHDPDFAKVFLAEKAATLQALAQANPSLLQTAVKSVRENPNIEEAYDRFFGL